MTLSKTEAPAAFTAAFRVWQRMQQLLEGGELVVDGKSLDIGAVAAVA